MPDMEAKIEKKWVPEHGEGHWVVLCSGEYVTSCDDSEVAGVIRQLQDEILTRVSSERRTVIL